MKIEATNSMVAYHIKDGATVFNYAVDAHSAVSRFPEEWSFTPWSSDGKKSAPLIAIPEDWQEQSTAARINLAMALSGEPRKGMTAAKADDIILAEVERREAEAEKPEATKEPK